MEDSFRHMYAKRTEEFWEDLSQEEYNFTRGSGTRRYVVIDQYDNKAMNSDSDSLARNNTRVYCRVIGNQLLRNMKKQNEEKPKVYLSKQAIVIEIPEKYRKINALINKMRDVIT